MKKNEKRNRSTRFVSRGIHTLLVKAVTDDRQTDRQTDSMQHVEVKRLAMRSPRYHMHAAGGR